MRFDHWLEHRVTEDPGFKSWFAGSVLTLSDGRPMPLFHGTDMRFDSFERRPGKRFILFSQIDVTAHGHFFTENPEDAKNYGRNVVMCYVRMTRPLLDPKTQKHLGVDRLPRQTEIDLGKIIAPMIQREANGAPFFDMGVSRFHINPRRSDFPLDWVYHAVNSNGLAWDVLDIPGAVARLKALGYDGTWVGEDQDATGRSVFVPDASQIRIAEWNPRDTVLTPEDRWWEED